MVRSRLLVLPVAGLATLVPSATHADEPADVWTIPPPGEDITCPDATVDVDDADELQAALDDAQPGDVIGMADGTYVGTFVTTATASAEQPIVLCGSTDAILDGATTSVAATASTSTV